jgi:hypothetical protein
LNADATLGRNAGILPSAIEAGGLHDSRRDDGAIPGPVDETNSLVQVLWLLLIADSLLRGRAVPVGNEFASREILCAANVILQPTDSRTCRLLPSFNWAVAC